jgi:hypothetical protein
MTKRDRLLNLHFGGFNAEEAGPAKDAGLGQQLNAAVTGTSR